MGFNSGFKGLRTECGEHFGLKETNGNMENGAKGESL